MCKPLLFLLFFLLLAVRVAYCQHTTYWRPSTKDELKSEKIFGRPSVIAHDSCFIMGGLPKDTTIWFIYVLPGQKWSIRSKLSGIFTFSAIKQGWARFYLIGYTPKDKCNHIRRELICKGDIYFLDGYTELPVPAIDHRLKPAIRNNR